ncbi:hypothetical protein Tco_0375105 [Tanacetum coccineum]
MPSYESEMTPKDVKSLALRYGIPLDLHPVALMKGWTMDKLSDDMIGLYEQYFEFSGIRVPFSSFLLAVIKHFCVHISQFVPLGLNQLTMFKLYCRSLGIVPSVNLFRVFYKVSKQGHWFSFEKRVGKDVGGQVFQETFSGLKGWKKRFLFLDRRAIPDVMAWTHHDSDVTDPIPEDSFHASDVQLLIERVVDQAIPDAMAWTHHDSDVNDPIPEDGFHALDVQLLIERVVDLRLVPSGLLFHGGLAITWDFPGFRPVFKDTDGNGVTMSEYLSFPFLSGASISKGPPLTSQDQIEQHTTRPLSSDQPISEKTDHQKEVEVEDPKIIAIRERKGSHPKTKRKKNVARKDGPATSEATSSPKLIRIVNPNQADPSNVDVATAELREQRSPRDSVGHSIHNYSGQHDDERIDTLRLGAFGGNIDEGESSWGRAFYVPDWSIHRRCSLDTLEWCRELMVHLAPPVAQEESNALNNATALERAWFSLVRGALAQTNILGRFEQLPASFDELAGTHAGCEDTVRQLMDARELSQLNSMLYLDQSLRIKELEDLLAKKDSALVYAERINYERAQKKEKLVTQLGKTEMEKFDSIRKLLPTVVEHLFKVMTISETCSNPSTWPSKPVGAKDLPRSDPKRILQNL